MYAVRTTIVMPKNLKFQTLESLYACTHNNLIATIFGLWQILDSTHLAGAGALPLRIGTDIRGVKFKTLPYYELEKGLNRFFHRWPWKILQI